MERSSQPVNDEGPKSRGLSATRDAPTAGSAPNPRTLGMEITSGDRWAESPSEGLAVDGEPTEADGGSGLRKPVKRLGP